MGLIGKGRFVFEFHFWREFLASIFSYNVVVLFCENILSFPLMQTRKNHFSVLRNGCDAGGFRMRGDFREFNDWISSAEKATWSVAKLAKLINVSPRTLEMYFAAVMGQPPKSWMLEQRQRKAWVLLNEGYLVKQVAVEVGYKHSTHFSREFKKYWGYSPTRKVEETAFI